jgi:hypothetical protein
VSNQKQVALKVRWLLRRFRCSLIGRIFMADWVFYKYVTPFRSYVYCKKFIRLFTIDKQNY